MDKYLNKDVARITGLKQSTIAYYSDKGIVEPSVSKGTGRGSNRYYGKVDLVKFITIGLLSDSGVSLKKIQQIFTEQRIVIDPLITRYLEPWDSTIKPIMLRIYNVHDVKKMKADVAVGVIAASDYASCLLIDMTKVIARVAKL